MLKLEISMNKNIKITLLLLALGTGFGLQAMEDAEQARQQKNHEAINLAKQEQELRQQRAEQR